MKTMKHTYCFLALSGLIALNSCKDDDPISGNPVMDFKTEAADAYFGDSLPFTINATDVDVPLSTLKAQLYFGEEMVSQTVIRTKVSGEDYTGKIYIPFHANIPNGTATLKFILQNINFTITEKEQDLYVSRPDFPYMTLVTSDAEYRMNRIAVNEYGVTKSFPSQVKGYLKSPKMGDNGNELNFGWSNGGIVEHETAAIPFSNSKAGRYAITFNSYSYEATPFIKFKVNGQEMEMLDEANYMVDMNLQQGATLSITGIPSFDEWWMDTDFFEKQPDGTFRFVPVSGDYRLKANSVNKYFVVEAMKGTEPATLQADGTGAMWVIGDGIGKPSLAANEVSWNTDKALCMAQVAPKKYQITGVAGKQLNANSINFKFFHQKGWGGEYSDKTLTTASNLVFVGDGENGRDKGNLGLPEGTALEAGFYYRFTVDLSAGRDNAVLSVEKMGEEPAVERNPLFDGAPMIQVDENNFKVERDFVPGNEFTIGGDVILSDWWLDSDYFEMSGDKIRFTAAAGKYRITANYTFKYLQVDLMDGSSLASLKPDGSGAIWILGNGIGKPSFDNAPAWSGSRGVCMAPVAPGKFAVTLEPGVQLSVTNLDVKFFHQCGWGGEFTAKTLSTDSPLLEITSSGNVNLKKDAVLNEEATYILTMDVTAGNDNAVLSLTEK